MVLGVIAGELPILAEVALGEAMRVAGYRSTEAGRRKQGSSSEAMTRKNDTCVEEQYFALLDTFFTYSGIVEGSQ